MEDSVSYHHRNGDYIRRLPTPPRPSFISPFSVGAVGPNIDLQLSRSLPFLQDIDWQGYFRAQESVNDWTYENRRNAQSVLPYLYLGPSTVCKDAGFLQQAKIGMVLAVRHANPLHTKPLSPSLLKAQQHGAQVQTLDVTSAQELVAAFGRAADVINSHVASHGVSSCVFVCCDTGNFRSAAVATTYCMDVLGISLEMGLQYIHARRFCTSFDDSLKYILQSYADILQARRDVMEAVSLAGPAASTTPLPTNNTKRARTYGDDDDEAMAAEDDAARFEDRSFTPFNG